MSFQVVSTFILHDGDVVILGLDKDTGLLYLTSTEDQSIDRCHHASVRRTIQWAIGRDADSNTPVEIHGLVRHHTELLADGVPWVELCNDDQAHEFLNGTWDSIIANNIRATFLVTPV